jgi:hypothetical protein
LKGRKERKLRSLTGTNEKLSKPCSKPLGLTSPQLFDFISKKSSYTSKVPPEDIAVPKDLTTIDLTNDDTNEEQFHREQIPLASYTVKKGVCIFGV